VVTELIERGSLRLQAENRYKVTDKGYQLASRSDGVRKVKEPPNALLVDLDSATFITP
jgi:hypothetical protein